MDFSSESDLGPEEAPQLRALLSQCQAELAAMREHARRLEAAQEQLNAIVEGSRDAIWTWTADGTIVRWNRQAERLFGYTADEIIGQSLLRLVPKERHAKAHEMIPRLGRGNGYEQYVTVRLRKDGTPVDVELTVSPIVDAQGNVLGASTVCRDITERKQFEASLARGMNRLVVLYRFTDRLQRIEALGDAYAAALDAIVEALGCSRASLLLFDRSGVMRFVAWRGLSEAYRNAVDGHSPWTAESSNPAPVLIEDIEQTNQPESLKAVIRTEGIRALAFIPVVTGGRLTGKFMAYYETSHVFSEEDLNLAGTIARQLGFAVARLRADEARRSAEGALRALSARLKVEVDARTRERDRIWDVSEDLFAVATFEGRFLSVNPAWTRLLGWSEDEITSMHVNELRHPDDAAHSNAGRAKLAAGASTVRMENRFRHKDGSWRWISWTLSADNGLMYVGGRHVTSEKEARAALERAQRQSAHLQKMDALGQLTGGVAHDFNNLLMIVSGHAQRLKRRLADPKDLRSLEAIQMAASRGESLTRQLLSFSRSQPLHPSIIAPAATVNAIRDVLAGSIHVNVEFSIGIPESVWPICVDQSELELALVNLAVNARDAMPERGTLSITAVNVQLGADATPDGLTGEFVALTVADSGHGIPPSILPKVFEPFFTTKDAEKGTGLGLSQVYGFARRSGGTVVVASDVGIGTSVTMYLPRSRGAVMMPSHEDVDSYKSRDNELILVVEDNREVRIVAEELLEQLGYRSVAVDCAARALDVLATSRDVDLVFTDVVLPGQTDGLALARTIKDHYPGVPIVLTTGYSKVFDTDPEFPVLRKPYQIAVLGRAVRKALDVRNQDGPAL